MDKQLWSALAALRDAADSVRCSGEVLDLGPYVDAFAELCKGLFSDEDMSFGIAIVFDEETGLFSIVESLVTLRDNSVAKGREKCWHFLKDFVELIGSRALPYAPLLKVWFVLTCYSGLNLNCPHLFHLGRLVKLVCYI